jgi:hypothetical protein
MEAATLFQLARLHDCAAACVLGVSDVIAEGDVRTRIDPDALVELGVRLGEVGADALAAVAGATR